MMPPVTYCIDYPCNASSAAGKRWKGSRNTRILALRIGYEQIYCQLPCLRRRTRPEGG